MNLASLSLRYRVVTVVISLLVILAGIQAYQTLGRLEDPSFPLKQAVVTTAYPGASPEEVASEVTDPLESAIQQLDQIDYVTSQSIAGRSKIDVFIRDEFRGEQLPQIWDELRRKVTEARPKLPPGAMTPSVNDDFGDVYGVLFYIYGDGYSLTELNDFADFVRDELLLVPGVGSVSLQGQPREAIYIDVNQERLKLLGTNLRAIGTIIEGQGSVTPGASVDIDDQRLRVVPDSTITDVEAIKNLTITSSTGATYRLGEIADIAREVIEPAVIKHRFNNHEAIAVGVSGVAGGNVVDMGQAVQQRLREIEQQTPIGIEFGVVSMQSESVSKAVSGFTIGLLESVAIVVGVLLFAMGLRAGVLIGGILLLTILGTFIIMKSLSVDLQRISLGALIIALGMLVDNAIVIVEGIISGSKQGMSRGEAAKKIVGQTTWPLLGATVIAILAFAPIGLSPDSTGDYCGSLFTVIWVSLGLSWVFAVTSTPVIGSWFLRSGSNSNAENKNPYDGYIFRKFRALLETLLAYRWPAVAVLIVLLVVSVIGFGKAKQGFFPASSRPQFMVDVWLKQGSQIDVVDRELQSLAGWIREQPGVTDVAANIGAGALRFELTYSPESPNTAFGQLLISVEDEAQINALREKIESKMNDSTPMLHGWTWRMVLGPGGKAKIQARLRGPDPNVLRTIGQQYEQIMRSDPYAANLRTDWRQRMLVVQPEIDQTRAAQLGVTRSQVNQALQIAYDGLDIGLLRDGDDLIPIKLRSQPGQSPGAGQLPEVLVPATTGKFIPLDQVAPSVKLGWEDPIIGQRNRAPTFIVQCDPKVGSTSELFNRLRPQIEAIELPVGYTLEWGGEYESSTKASGGLISLLPVCFGGMALILLLLFNNLRQPLIILLTVPLAIIGVTVGLLTTGSEFGFMPILGVLSLAGMLIKNAIVLIDEANALTATGMSHYDAILDSAVSRARPVVLAALTTVLGMLPLLTDVFFKDMAVVIIFGLSFATVLTLFVVPLLYAIFYKARPA